MSGVKETKIDITNVQWNNLQNRMNELDNKNKEYARMLQQERENSNRIVNELSNRSQREIAILQQNFNSKLQEQEAAYSRKLSQKIEQTRREAEELRRKAAEEQDRKFRAEIEAEAKQREKQIKELEDEMNRKITETVETLREELDKKELEKIDLANKWLNIFDDLYNEIKSGRQHQEHCQPGRMSTLRLNYENALNMRDSTPEAAIGLIINGVSQLTQFSIDLAHYEMQWQERYCNISEMILGFEDRIAQSRNAGYKIDDNEFYVDLNTWSHGGIVTVEESLSKIKQELLERNHELSKKELDDIARQIEVLDNKFETTRNEAIQGLIASENRIEIISNISDELRVNGWVTNDSGYLDNNPEEGVYITLQSVNGNDEMRITIQQDSRLVVEQHLDGVRTAEIERQNGKTLMRILSEADICAEALRETTRRPELTTGIPRGKGEYYIEGENN